MSRLTLIDGPDLPRQPKGVRATLPIVGVVVTYQPSRDVLENLQMVAAECERVIVVDNGSPLAMREELARVPGVELLALPENQGVAAALNAGAHRALEMGYQWIVTLDQDSQPQNGMVAALWESHCQHPSAAVVGPCIIEHGVNGRAYRWVRQHPRWRWLFQRIRCRENDLVNITEVITSGAMVELATWGIVGGFDDELFIDYVDVDYCLKVGRKNRSIIVSSDAKLHHRLGARQSKLILGKDFRPMHHLAFRHYYMARNRVRIWRRHAAAVPHWALFDLCFAVYNTLRVIAFEREKSKKLMAIALGTWDGLRNRAGECPISRRKAFKS